MPEIDLVQVFGLLEKANQQGVRISFEHDELILRYPRNETIDRDLFNELKSNKDSLREYFKSYDTHVQGQLTRFEPNERIEHEGRTYYRIMPTLVWWVDDLFDLEFKQKIFGLLNYKMSGYFDTDVLRKAIRYLVKRHESLRSTFHKIGEEYMMYIADEDSPLFEAEINDIRDLLEDQEAVTTRLLQFEGHQFDLRIGPLFIVRVIQTAHNQYYLAVKIHHAIFDGWSLEVLLRDLYTIYLAIAKGKEPELPALALQYKEYMALINRYTRDNYESHKHYWELMYSQLPDEMIIPGARNRAEAGKDKKNCQCTLSELPVATAQKVNDLSKKYSVSLFIVLQAAFKAFLFHLTGQYDILIGTEVFGRENLVGIEEQIGFYSRTNVIRTVLEEKDSFRDVIAKVRRSNDDMVQYRAFSLLNALSALMPLTCPNLYCSYLKFTLNFKDATGFHVNNIHTLHSALSDSLDVTLLPDLRGHAEINWDMDLDFYNLKERIELKIIYDSNTYDLPAVEQFVAGYFSYIDTYAS